MACEKVPPTSRCARDFHWTVEAGVRTQQHSSASPPDLPFPHLGNRSLSSQERRAAGLTGSPPSLLMVLPGPQLKLSQIILLVLPFHNSHGV